MNPHAGRHSTNTRPPINHIDQSPDQTSSAAAGALSAQRRSLVGKNLVHRVLKLARGIHHLRTGSEGWCQNPGTGHPSPAFCPPACPAPPRPTIAHTHSPDLLLWDDWKASSHMGRARLNLPGEEKRPLKITSVNKGIILPSTWPRSDRASKKGPRHLSFFFPPLSADIELNPHPQNKTSHSGG